MATNPITINIDWQWALGIIGTLILIAFYAGSRLGRLENSMGWIKTELTNLWTAILGKEAIRHGLEGKGSPLNPTELGWKYIKESGLENIVDHEKRDELLAKLKETLGDNTSEYDVQESARKLLLSIKDDPMFKPVKDYAFNNGIDADIILILGGLLLRDNYLNRQHQSSPQSGS